MSTTIQTAVAQERSAIVNLLVNREAEMPIMIAIPPEQSIQEGKKIARKLRCMNSFYDETRDDDGKFCCSGVSPLTR